MKQSLLIKQWSHGACEAFVKTDMTGYYLEFLDSIPASARKREDKFKHSIACVVWGAFYLEATINDIGLKVIQGLTGGTDEIADFIWQMFERERTGRKFQFVLAAVMPDKMKRKCLLKQVEDILDLRNKLAHYKELPTRVSPRRVLEKAGLQKGAFIPKFVEIEKVNTGITNAVLKLSANDRRVTIYGIVQQIEAALDAYNEARWPKPM